jgi:hypothetical protein
MKFCKRPPLWAMVGDDIGSETLGESGSVGDARLVLAVGDEKDRVPALERGQIGHDRVKRVGRGDHHQTSGLTELEPALVDEPHEFGIADRLVVGDQGRRIRSAAEQGQAGRRNYRGHGWNDDFRLAARHPGTG